VGLQFDRFEQAEPAIRLDAAGPDVRAVAGALDAFDHVADALVVPASRLPLREDQKSVWVDLNPAGRCLALVRRRDNLRDDIDDEVFVVDGGCALDRWAHLDPILAMLVELDRSIWLLRDRVERMLHRGHVIL